jgi:hypothetical protein
MAYTTRLQYEPLRSFDSASLSGTYQPIGTPLAFPASIIKIVNTSAVNVTISTDGVNDMEIVPANGFVLYDITSNTPPPAGNATLIPAGTQYMAMGAASTGLIYLVTQYIVQV